MKRIIKQTPGIKNTLHAKVTHCRCWVGMHDQTGAYAPPDEKIITSTKLSYKLPE